MMEMPHYPRSAAALCMDGCVPTAGMPTCVRPHCLGTLSPQASPGPFELLQAHLSLFICFFPKQEKDVHVIEHKNIHEAPSQARREGITKALPHADTLPVPVPATQVKTHWRNLFPFFLYPNQTPHGSDSTFNRTSPPKGNSKHEKGKTNPQKSPPLHPPKVQRGKGG